MAIHWKVPTIITCSLLAGILLAVGHHLFYASLNGRLVDDAKVPSLSFNFNSVANSSFFDTNEQAVHRTMFGQSINNGIGTAFAFLVQSTLAIAVTTAYWQGFWGAMSRKRLSIATVDPLAARLTALQEMFNINGLKLEPLLVGIAVLAWLLPVPSVLTPGTLTVHSVQLHTSNEALLPGIDFLGTDFPGGKIARYPTHSWGDTYLGPTERLIRLGFAAATQGSISAVPAPAVNASYNLTFHGPAVNCTPISDDILRVFLEPTGYNLTAHSQYGYFDAVNSTKLETPLQWKYLSWVPYLDLPDNQTSWSWSETYASSDPQGLGNGSMAGFGAPLPVDNTYGGSGSFIADDDTGRKLVVATWNNSEDIWNLPANATTAEAPSNWNVVGCLLQNATYEVEFSFDGQEQAVRVLSTKFGDVLRYFDGQPSALDGFNKRWNVGPQSIDDDVRKIFSYNAIMELLGKLLVGSAWEEEAYQGVAGSLQQDSTSIFQTNLAFTPELMPLYQELAATNASQDNPYAATSTPSLSRAIEELFTNMTLSLFSKPAFLTKEATLPTTIKSRTMQNVYKYNGTRLAIAYGVQAGVALMIALLGSAFIIRNGACYSNDFSTVMRTTRHAQLSTDVTAADATGCDPLPKHIKRATLRTGRRAATDAMSDSTAYNPGKLFAGVNERTTMISVRHGSTW